MFATGPMVTIKVEPPLVWLPGVRVCFSLEGFESEAIAEDAGQRFALALMWAAVACNFPLSLAKEAGRTCTVFPRPQPRVMQMWGTSFNSPPPKLAIDQADALFSRGTELEPEWLLSLEIFTSARLETSDRAKFVAMVSALEPLVKPLELPAQVTALVESAIKQLTETTALCNSHKESLRTRLNALKKQSIGQSLREFIGTWLPSDSGAQKIVDQAYQRRSGILHRGEHIEDLEAQCQALETVIRKLYQAKLDTPLVR